jgi:PAS domain-containing protein
MAALLSNSLKTLMLPVVAGLVATAYAPFANATEPCGGLDECRAIVEINATDGDIGFHWLVDGGDLVGTEIIDPAGRRVYANAAFGPLRAQTLTESFGESAEPVCRKWLAEDPDDDVMTLDQFLRRWRSGAYVFKGTTPDGETLRGSSSLTFWLPAAPRQLHFQGGVISWEAGTSLGVCAGEVELWKFVGDGRLPIHPMNVPVKFWEVTLELEDGSGRTFSLRLPAQGPKAQTSVTLPPEFLASVGPDTPAKIEVGAVGGRLEIDDDDNATFTELTGLCLHRDEGCAEPD